jgi:hypothetical protein
MPVGDGLHIPAMPHDPSRKRQWRPERVSAFWDITCERKEFAGITRLRKGMMEELQLRNLSKQRKQP